MTGRECYWERLGGWRPLGFSLREFSHVQGYAPLPCCAPPANKIVRMIQPHSEAPVRVAKRWQFWQSVWLREWPWGGRSRHAERRFDLP